ncbi:MAG: YfhO family protein, partial [Thermomicrobiales bacterium]
LDLLASGAVDGRKVALVEDPALVFAPGEWDASAVPATVSRPDPDRMDIALDQPAQQASMLVVSEVYDTNWTASVDGESAPVAVVDHALMGVPIPAGAREIVLRYEPRSLRIGLLVTSVAALLAFVVWTLNGVRWFRRRGAD